MTRLVFGTALLVTASALQASITGVLVDEQAKPVAGATIRAYATEDSRTIAKKVMAGATDRAVIATAQSAENGSFKVDSKAPLSILAIDGNGLQVRLVEAGDGEDLNVIVMRPEKELKVRLVASGKPVANALVVSGPLTARSDADGIVDLPDVNASMSIIHPDYAPLTLYGAPNDGVRDVQMSAGVTVRGRVLAADGQPAPNVTVMIAGRPLTQSAGDGSFTIAHAPSNWKLLTATDATRAVSVQNTRADTYDIKLQPAGTISGTTLPGSRIYIENGIETGVIESVNTDAQGRFTSPPLASRAYTVRVSHEGYVAGRAEVMLRKGENVVKAFPLKSLSVVRGRVVDEQKQPVEGAFIATGPATWTRQSYVRTNAAGEFTIRYPELPNFRPPVVAVKGGYAAGIAPMEAGPLTITLPKGIPLEVRVVDRQRKNVGDATVMMMGGAEEPGLIAQFEAACEQPLRATCRTTDDTGAIHLRVTPGAYQTNVRGPSIASRNQVSQNITAASSPLTIEVDRGVSIAGRVEYSDRTPASDVMVTVRVPGANGMTRTDSDGAFVLKNVLPGRITIVASDSSRVESPPVEIEAPARGVALTIPAAARIEGRVVDKESSAPVTDFQIGVMFGGGRGGSIAAPQSVHSEDGSFVVDRVAPGNIELHVSAPGYAPGRLNNLTTEEGKTLRVADVQLDRGGSIRGRVTANGEAVAGVFVRQTDVRGLPAFRGGGGNSTDANGEYTVDGIGAGEHTLEFMRDGFVPKRKTIEIARGKESRVDVELDRGQTLRGRVVDKNGQPVAGARISVRGAAPAPMRPGTSDASGNFVLQALAEGKYNLQATKQGYVEAQINDVTVPATASVTLTMDSGATLSGRVIGLTQTELAAAEVSASWRSSSARSNVNEDGTFTLRGVADGRVTVNAFVRSGMRQRQSVAQMVEIVNGAGPSVQIDFSEGLTMTGRVTRNGVPLTSGSVNFSGKAGRSGQVAPDGTYQVDGLTPGDYMVGVYTQGGSMSRSKYTVASSSTYDIQIEGGAIRGRVVDAATNAPVSDVTVVTIGTRENPMTRQAVTDSTGRFTLDAVPDGTIEVRASPRQRYAMKSQPVVVTSGTAPEIEFRLESVQPSIFRVTDAASAAPIEAVVSVRSGKTAVANSMGARSDDGAVRVYVPSGSYTASIWAQGYVAQNVNFSSPGPEVRVALQIGGRIVLTASRLMRVRVATPAGDIRDQLATPAGAAMEGLGPGVHRIDLLSNADGKTVTKSLTATVIPGQTVYVNVD